MSSGLGDVANTIVLAAATNVVGATGVAGRARGCAVARTGLGVYTATLDASESMVANETLISVGLLGTDDRIVRSVVTSPSVVTVTSETLLGAAADADFNLKIERLL